MRETTSNDFGIVKIHKKVISSIASIATKEVEGVVKIGGSFKSSLLQSLLKSDYCAIIVDIDKNNEVRISIPVVIRYGFNLPSVAGQIQDNVRKAFEKMTDLSLKEINVNVQEIEGGNK
ncbi:MAG: Asp23/Gls24 family envelope stress response protein [Candidatus Omnitrophota bacterium]